MGASRANTRAQHKHDLRKCFHAQLKRFWDFHPTLKSTPLQDPNSPGQSMMIIPFLEQRFSRVGYNFVPLVVDAWGITCAVSILMLRPDLPGTLIKSGDLDNRLKTIFDALRMPNSTDELGGYDTPEDSERPFYCLLQDDSLITNVAVEADTLYETVSDPPNENDTRLIIKVELKPYSMTMFSLLFG